VTIQAQILALLRRLREELSLTVLLITHDLGVVAENAHRVGVMYAGRIVEEGPVAGVLGAPQHPYTRGLLRSVPGRKTAVAGQDARRLPTLPGSVPDPTAPPPGCRFHPRCAERLPRCDRVDPRETATAPGRRVACLLYESETVGEPAP
jgi:oligopeptide/dipeptide ABC transporter ATP-binding protein